MNQLNRISRYIIISLFFIIVINSCFIDKDKQELLSNKKIEVVFVDNASLNFSNYFDQPEFIPLETTDYNLFKDITDIKIKKDKIFVFSMFPDNMVSIYDLNGKYLNRTDNAGRGRGPGDIDFSTSFDVDTCVTILDRGNRKIIDYNFDGQFISETSLDNLYFNSFSFFNNNRMIFYEYHQSRKTDKNNTQISKLSFWKYDKDSKLKLIGNAWDLNEGKDIPITLKSFYTINRDQLYYWDAFNDSILRIDLKTFNNNLQCVVDFGKYRIPDDVSKNELKKKVPFERFYDKVIKKGYATIFDFHYCGIDRQIFIIFRFINFSVGITGGDEGKLICYPKICLDNISAELTADLNPTKLFLIHHDNSFVYFEWKTLDFIKTFQNLKNQLSSDAWKSVLNSNPSLDNILKKIKIDDNPIIMKARLK